MYEVSHNISEIAQEVGAQAPVEPYIPMMRRSRDIPTAERLEIYLAKQAKRAAKADAVKNDVDVAMMMANAPQGNVTAQQTVKRERSVSPNEGVLEELAHMECVEKQSSVS